MDDILVCDTLIEEEIFSVTQPSIPILQAYILAYLHPATFRTGP
jgi:hypothetical protein